MYMTLSFDPYISYFTYDHLSCKKLYKQTSLPLPPLLFLQLKVTHYYNLFDHTITIQKFTILLLYTMPSERIPISPALYLTVPPYVLRTTKPVAIPAGEPFPEPIHTDRLILRLFNHFDNDGYHNLVRQPEVMQAEGIFYDPHFSTIDKFFNLLPTSTSYFYFGIFLNEGEMIGSGGICELASPETGWPRLEFKFKKEYWGQGYATEFVTAFLEFWWKLPRQETVVFINKSLVDPQNTTGYTPELLYARTSPDNTQALRVMVKSGFSFWDQFENGFFNWKYTKPLYAQS